MSSRSQFYDYLVLRGRMSENCILGKTCTPKLNFLLLLSFWARLNKGKHKSPKKKRKPCYLLNFSKGFINRRFECFLKVGKYLFIFVKNKPYFLISITSPTQPFGTWICIIAAIVAAISVTAIL